MARSAELAAPASVTRLRPGQPTTPGGRRPASAPRLFLGAVGLAQALVFGAAGLFGGYYDFAVWGVLSAVTLVALAAALVVRPRKLSGPAYVVAGGLLGLLLLSALSLTWADSVDRAWTEVNRLVFYLATFLLAALVLRPGRSIRVVTAVIGAAIGTGALVVLVRLLAGDTGAFLIYRLNAPVDYINGTACLMLMGIWPLIALAERDGPPALAGAAVGLAGVEASLLVLTEARAVIPAMLGSALLMLCLIPGRVTRFWALVAVTAGAALALPWTLAVYSHRDAAHPDGPSAAAVTHAGVAALLGGLAAGAIWALARHVAARPLSHRMRRVPRAAAVCLLLAVPVAVLAVNHHPWRSVRTQWHAFTSLQVTQSSTVRFTDASGYRYDLWRVAVKEFEQRPVGGVGAGSYGLRYFQLRKTPESVRQPHSLELQMLAELGVPGLVALLALILGVGWALRRSRRRDVALTVALGGTAAVWLLDTSVDWVYNMPGLTGVALLSAAGLCALAVRAQSPVPLPGGPVLAAAPESSAVPPPARDRRVVAWTLAVIALVAVGAPALVRQYLAQQRSDSAAATLVASPRRALADARDALRLNGSRVETYYTQAAAFARLGDYPDARNTLLEAVRVEPLNYVPWVLLGDLATRRGDAPQASEAYGQARRLNPGDAAIFTPPAGA
ncbi:MAG: O-antigen ligase family protein [Solirubrobacteraceae bacterium]